MKKLILATLLMSASLLAVDFTQMTTEELSAMRGSVAVEDRDAFRAEMQSRMQAMTTEERQAFMQANGMGQGQGAGMGQGPRDGSGMGRGMGGRNR